MAEDPITVFGGTGYLGRSLVRHLALAGRPVRVAARHPARPAIHGSSAEIGLQAADIRNDASVAEAVRGAGGVVNAVGLYIESGEATFEDVHVDGAARVARYARHVGARLVHVSGIGADPASRSRYIAARGRGEAAVRTEYPETIIVRPSVLFGPGDAFLSMLELASRFSPVVPLFGRGDTRMQPVHVDDVAAAITRLLTPPFPADRLFELGGGAIHTYREIIALVLDHLGRRRALAPVPFTAWKILARPAGILPNAPLTIDQVQLMESDNVVGEGVATFSELGIEPRTLDDALAECL